MDLERWRKVDGILQAALALSTAERSTFVARACEADESLRYEVMSLLSLEEQAPDIIDTPALEMAATLLASDQPDLAEGQYVGKYRILSLLGTGGMGEVYLAEDTELGRKIALKLLPPDFTSDGERVHRFRQEARAASALNHPCIVTIYETGEFQHGHFIATEFIEGETLRERLRRSLLNLEETLDVAVQVTGALAAAHRAAIIHRDIKPENIMLRPDGYVKVVDFGLAKLVEPSVTDRSSGLSSNESDTTPGLLIGTLRYMSPEQAQGLNLDARSDIFSLGIVLYEMLSGRPPFDGETNDAMIAGLLQEEAAPLSLIVPELPAELGRIVGKALSKNRNERYQTMEELGLALRTVRRELEVEQTLGNTRRTEAAIGMSSGPPPKSQTAGAAASPSIIRRLASHVVEHKLQAGVILLVPIVAAGGFFFTAKQYWRTRGVFQDIRISQIVETDKSSFVAISPDGRYLAHTVVDGMKQSLLLRPTATNSNTVLVPPIDAWFSGITFSRDGSSVYCVLWGADDPTYALYRVSISGGDSQKVMPNVASPITISPDGTRLAFVRAVTTEETALFVANADGTGERQLGKRRFPDFFTTAGPSWSPDGRLIACAVFDAHPDERPGFMNVTGIDVLDGSERMLSNGKWSKIPADRPNKSPTREWASGPTVFPGAWTSSASRSGTRTTATPSSTTTRSAPTVEAASCRPAPGRRCQSA